LSPLDGVLVLGAGALAGGVNAIAGGGTLISFPALVAVGLPPVQANTTSSVGLVFGYASGARAYRPELAGQRGRARALLPPAIVGGAVGAALLLLLPSESFDAVVPWLVLLACALIALQPRLAGWLGARGVAKPHPGWEVQLGVGLGAVYGGYFGAGLGVILFAVLALLVPDEPLRLNALRGLQSLTVNAVAAVVFVVTGHVHWLAAVLLAAGAWCGAIAGVRLSRRLSPQAVRTAVVLVGTAAGITMLIRQ
jgi:uncharacterized membrane protein YfcA